MLVIILLFNLAKTEQLREQVLAELTSNGVLLRTVVDLIVERLEKDNLSGERKKKLSLCGFERVLQ